jgi:endonuclease/exonuclease/phosphatase family metal-dependent hydrolase
MFVNTHFDNSGVNKDPSALLFNERIAALAKDIPMVVTGDFNTTALDKRYRHLVGGDNNIPYLQNTFDLINHETVDIQSHPNSLSDHIFTGGPCKAHTDNWFIDHRPLKNGQRMSDHLAILAKIHFAT